MLEQIKFKLRTRAVAIYLQRAEELDMDIQQYKHHYAELGWWMYQIDQHSVISTLINSLYEGDFDHLGYFEHGDVDEMLESLDR